MVAVVVVVRHSTVNGSSVAVCLGDGFGWPIITLWPSRCRRSSPTDLLARKMKSVSHLAPQMKRSGFLFLGDCSMYERFVSLQHLHIPFASVSF